MPCAFFCMLFVSTELMLSWKISSETNDRNFLLTERGLESMSASTLWLIKVSSWPLVADSSFTPYCFEGCVIGLS